MRTKKKINIMDNNNKINYKKLLKKYNKYL